MADGDNVATALEALGKGCSVELIEKKGDRRNPMAATEEIPPGHKIALNDIARGEEIYKYGVTVGYATRAIPLGTLVHVHNVRSHRIDIPETIIGEILRQMGLEHKEVGRPVGEKDEI